LVALVTHSAGFCRTERQAGVLEEIVDRLGAGDERGRPDGGRAQIGPGTLPDP
jgi:hypothetical protein